MCVLCAAETAVPVGGVFEVLSFLKGKVLVRPPPCRCYGEGTPPDAPVGTDEHVPWFEIPVEASVLEDLLHP